MSSPDFAEFRHDHHDDHVSSHRHERAARAVVALTFAMMLGELAVGYWTRSLALTADGWHMATHAGALGMAALAYWFARTRARAASFTFGTGKVHALAGYTSAVLLAVVAAWMLWESASRLTHPVPVAFDEALPVAVLGLLVNLASMKLLHSDDSDHDHDHDHDHAHDHDHHARAGDATDHNLRAAYFHVLADAFTSVLAIVALLGGRYGGWAFLDPMMGIVGATVILRWAWGLCASAARQLLDMSLGEDLSDRIRARLERMSDTRVVDLHLWQLGPRRCGCIVSLVTSQPRAPADYRVAIAEVAELSHITVEVQTRAS